jgi:hypothetical protein
MHAGRKRETVYVFGTAPAPGLTLEQTERGSLRVGQDREATYVSGHVGRLDQSGRTELDRTTEVRVGVVAPEVHQPMVGDAGGKPARPGHCGGDRAPGDPGLGVFVAAADANFRREVAPGSQPERGRVR